MPMPMPLPQDEIIAFLSQVPPFHLVDTANLARMTGNISLEYYPRGTRVLHQEGPAVDCLRVIKKGGVKIWFQGGGAEEKIIDMRSEGELFGILSILTGEMSRANVDMVEDTICYLIPRDDILHLTETVPATHDFFLKNHIIGFLDKARDTDHSGTGAMAAGDRLLFNTPLERIVKREPVTAIPDLSIREGAVKMAQQRISSLVIVDQNGRPVGMVTDRDLREKVVATGLPVSSPLARIMSAPVISAKADELCVEALTKMMRHKVHHVLVTRKGLLLGVVTNHDLMVLQGSSPAMLMKEFAKIRTIDELQESNTKLVKTAAGLLRNGALANNISVLLVELLEKIVVSIYTMHADEMGGLPDNATLFCYGGAGRRETSLEFTPRLGILHGSHATRGKNEQPFFEALGEKVNDTLCRFVSWGGHVLLPENIMPLQQWDTFAAEPPSEENTGGKASLLEMRAIHGDFALVTSLRKKLIIQAQNSRIFLNLLATATVQNRLPLGFFKNFIVEKSGEHKNTFNVWERGMQPLVDVTRVLALAAGCDEISTRRRLAFLARNGFSPAKEIENVMEYLHGMILKKQLEQVQQKERPDCFLNPDRLSTFERTHLKESFNLAAELYEVLEERFDTARI